MSIDISSVSVQFSLNRAGVVAGNYQNSNENTAPDLKGISLDQAVTEIISTAVNEYGGGSVVVTSVKAGSDSVVESLQSRIEAGVRETARENGFAATVYHAGTDAETARSAKEEGITSGKYYLIKLVQAVEPGLQTSWLAGESADRLIEIFVESYRKLSELADISDAPVPLSPWPGVDEEPQDNGGTPANTDTTDTTSGAFSEEAVAEQYRILSGITG